MAGSKAVMEERILTIVSDELLSTSALARKVNMRRDLLAGYMEALKHQGKVRLIKIGRSNVYSPVRRSARQHSKNVYKEGKTK